MAMLEVYQGDTKSFALSFTDANGAPMNMSGWGVFLGVSRSYNEGALFVVGTTGLNAAAVTGLVSLTLAPPNTNQCAGDYLADFAIYDPLYAPTGGKSTYPTDGLRILPTTIP